MKTITIEETEKGFQVLKNGEPYGQPQTYPAQAAGIAYELEKDEKAAAAKKAFWDAEDEKARAKGMLFRSGHAAGGNAYHKSREAAEAAAKKAARSACPENPPAWHVVEIQSPFKKLSRAEKPDGCQPPGFFASPHPMSSPDPDHYPSAVIVLRMPRARKGRYVAAARARGMKLFDWILATLDEASPPIPPHDHATPETQPQPDTHR